MQLNDSLRSLLFRCLRLGFRVTPMSQALRDSLRQRFIERHADLIPAGPRGRTRGTGSKRPLDHVGHRAIDWLPRSQASSPVSPSSTLVAFYLPQFHPTPENDEWWGPGFTEWRNVTRALPQFEGHMQPRLPGDLGFYDLRLPEVMRAQITLAREYGIGAFCTYFYWFVGKTLLEAPLRGWLSDSSLDFPICLCWANENWSRRWDGRADDLLIAQAHTPEDDLAFIEYISPYLRDPRYLRVDGKPILVVYRPGLLPDASATAARWRNWCHANGIGDIHIAYVQSFDNVDPRDIGFDSAISFPPNNTRLSPITARRTLINPDYCGQVYDWRDVTGIEEDPGYPLYPAVNPGWDNEARRSGRGRTFVHASPAGYAAWLREAIAASRRRTPLAPMVFINAWNEWAEGAVLEPDAFRGHAWLEATRAALRPVPAQQSPCVVLHVWHADLLEEMIQAINESTIKWRLIVTTSYDREKLVRAELERLGVNAEVHAFANRGRDILPFLKVLARLSLDGTCFILKLHTKKSEHRRDGDDWRRALLEALLLPSRAAKILETMGRAHTLGLVAPDGHLVGLDEYIGANGEAIRSLAGRMGAGLTPNATFVAGSMFWARVDALRPLLEMDLCDWEFEAEDGQLDGTLAHAIERLVVLAVEERGLVALSANSVVGELPSTVFTYAAPTGTSRKSPESAS